MTLLKTLCLCSVLTAEVFSLLTVIPELPLHTINVCEDEAHFRCREGEFLSVVGFSCGPDVGACPDNIHRTISNLCNGQQTCSSLDLGAMLSRDGCSSPIHVDFQCKKGSSSACQTDICAATSHGLVCPTDHVIHVRHMTCLTSRAAAECPRSSYSTLYMCEGAQHCDASGLRALLPSLCGTQSPDGTSPGVVVKYFCVPKSRVDTSCSTSRFHRLKGPFGVIRPPRLDSVDTDVSFREEGQGQGEATEQDDEASSTTQKPNSSSTGLKTTKKKTKKDVSPRCKWLINPRGDIIEVRVHQLTSTTSIGKFPLSSVGATASFSSSVSVCPDQGLLSIKYSDCEAGNQTRTLSVCSIEGVQSSKGQVHRNPPLTIQSCGLIKLTSAVPVRNGYQAAVDKLIISYHKMDASSEENLPAGISQCVPSPSPSLPLPDSITTMTSYLQDVTGQVNDPAAPSLISKKSGQAEQEKPASSSRFPKLKLFILYVVFGVLIVALLIALIVVIVSYHRISARKTRARGGSGERTALWLHPRQDDTPLDTFFQTNSLADGSAASMTSGSESSHRKVIASVHLEPDTTRTSTISGMSTFSRGQGSAENGRGRDSAGLKDLIDTFQSGTFPGYSSLRDLCGPARFSTGSLEAREDNMEYELTDTAPAVVGGLRHSYNEACDGGPLYVKAGSGQYAAVTGPDHTSSNAEHNDAEIRGNFTSLNSEGHYALPEVDDPYARINGGSLYSKPQEDSLYASPDGADYASPDGADYASPNGTHSDLVGDSGHYESSLGGGDCHYESLPCTDLNIYEAIGSCGENHKQHKKHTNHSPAARTTPQHQQSPPVPPPLPAPTLANGENKQAPPLDNFHYRVNNDEYAIVMKPNRLASAISSSQSSSANLGRPQDQNPDLTNGLTDGDSHEIENPYSQISDHHWKRRSAPLPHNGGFMHGHTPEDVV